MPSQEIDFHSKQKNSENPGVEDIDPKELLEKKAQLKIIDVRRPDEFTGELGHIPGAELIVLDLLPQRIGELSQDSTIVFVCRSGARSGKATAFAKGQGFEKVYNMKGGMLLWNELKLSVEGRSEN